MRNQNLKAAIAGARPKPAYVAAKAIPKENTVNRQGYAAYALDNFTKLLAMLCTLKVEPQAYRNPVGIIKDLQNLINICAKSDLLLTAQCIVFGRCMGEMRTINYVAAAMLAKHLAGVTWASRFYSMWHKKEQSGGVIYRADDMNEIATILGVLLGKDRPYATGAMKKGFAQALENMEPYYLLKYKKDLLDVINLSHPDHNNCKTVQVDANEYRKKIEILKDHAEDYNHKTNYLFKLRIDKRLKTIYIPVIEAIIIGVTPPIDTWESNQSEAGQLVAKAVADGKLSYQEAAEKLVEAKAENWEGMLNDGSLGILAALRNIRNILKNNPSPKSIANLGSLLSDGDKILKGKIMPHQLDLANEIILNEFNDVNSRIISKALSAGYISAIPNLGELMPGRTAIFEDKSGSMSMVNKGIYYPGTSTPTKSRTLAADKAAQLTATFALGLNADIIEFGDGAKFTGYNPNTDVFTLAKELRATKEMGSTRLNDAFDLIRRSKKIYDRIIILSDNECNSQMSASSAYKNYVQEVCNPYVYCIDLAAYGTVPLAGPKVKYYAGYGFQMFNDVSTAEFNPNSVMDKVRAIKI